MGIHSLGSSLSLFSIRFFPGVKADILQSHFSTMKVFHTVILPLSHLLQLVERFLLMLQTKKRLISTYKRQKAISFEKEKKNLSLLFQKILLFFVKRKGKTKWTKGCVGKRVFLRLAS